MEIGAILALASGAMELAERMYADLSAADKAKFEAEWNNMRSRVQTANAEWQAAGGATGAPIELVPGR